MLRADAAVFTPKEQPTDSGDKCLEVDENGCPLNDETTSTVAPSPALTGCPSPMLSPYWGFQEADAMWAAAAMYGCMPDGYPPEMFLPEHLQPGDDGYNGFSYGRPRAMTEPAYIDAFTFEGVDDLKTSLAGFVKQAAPEEDATLQPEVESQESTSAGVMSPPPGLAPPPGLELPPGLDVVEHTTGPKKRAVAATQSKISPLPYGSTTAMLRNIPNKYTQNGLVERLYEAGYCGELDFIYLPIDFKNKCNVGYAFLNFRTAEGCARFACEYHLCNSRDKLPGYNSKKVCEVSAARFQGCDENVRRLQASSVMGELIANPEWLPKLFDEQGGEVDFPVVEISNPPACHVARGRLQRRKGTM